MTTLDDIVNASSADELSAAIAAWSDELQGLAADWASKHPQDDDKLLDCSATSMLADAVKQYRLEHMAKSVNGVLTDEYISTYCGRKVYETQGHSGFEA